MILLIIKYLKSYLENLYCRNMTIDDAEKKQNKSDGVLGALSEYYAKKNQEYIDAKNKLLDNAKNFCKGREKIIEGLKIEYFH